ncbi:hypothetical protein RFI_29711 [Reticulomyxa filosa]|uniref:alpha-1,2-Mannosidase n=1 Tax=Reticulomyxa filosa TaxID=46433 RepID=X6M260_RETFI|nr:hypothetical protein RFI_29711 [Reticulomyxa filosa]|eukprot:ETO07681.1 hypothetical protein RFI_29711 [Reticulomyxa filosa]
MAAFETENGIPFAWVNLREGVLKDEITDTCTAGVGTLLVELSMLSYYTANDKYFVSGHKALLQLWKLRNKSNNLFGNSFDRNTLEWTNENSGIGAGIDSFYEYLLKTFLLTGYHKYWDMFLLAYRGALKYLRQVLFCAKVQKINLISI